MENSRRCNVCNFNIDVLRASYAKHLRTKKKKNKMKRLYQNGY